VRISSPPLLACAALSFLVAAGPRADAQLKNYDSKYYLVQSDLDAETVREAVLRMNCMAEEYYDRTKGMAAGRIDRKFKFMLFGTREGYRAAGGPDGSCGVFMASSDPARTALAAVRMADFPPDVLWHTIQHEGFHQFSHEVINGGRMSQNPPWLEEGLADYFGYALFTGEGLVPGVIPPDRLAMVQQLMPTGRFRPLDKLFTISAPGWLRVADGIDYLHVWSLVHFIVHADDGRRLPAFEQYIKAVTRPAAGQTVVNPQTFLGSFETLEAEWREWWLTRTPDATRDLYAKAAAGGLCAYLGRAAAQKKAFATAEDLLAGVGALKLADADWLPPGLPDSIGQWMRIAGPEVKFEIPAADKRTPANSPSPQVVASLADGTRVTATYAVGAKARRVSVEVDAMAVEVARASALLAEAKGNEARKVLQEAVRKYPRSPHLDAARKLVQQTFTVAAAKPPPPAVAVKPPTQVASATPRPGAESTPPKPPAGTGAAGDPPPTPPDATPPKPPAAAAAPAIKAPAPSPDLPPIMVISARFGVGDRWVNVTDQFREMVRDDTLKFPMFMSETLGVDPWPRRVKYVDIVLMLNGVPVRMAVGENHFGDPLVISAKRAEVKGGRAK
jgi:hypothetical protein